MLKLYRSIKQNSNKILNKFKPSAIIHKPEGWYFAPSAFTAYGWGKVLYKEIFKIIEFTVEDSNIIYAWDGVPSGIGEEKLCGYIKDIKLSDILLNEKMKYGIKEENWYEEPIYRFSLPEIIFINKPSVINYREIEYTYGNYNLDISRLKNKYEIY
jgi:hypothetical protein